MSRRNLVHVGIGGYGYCTACGFKPGNTRFEPGRCSGEWMEAPAPVVPTTITGTVNYVQRHGHTVYGNPMLSISIATDEVNANAGYAIVRISNNAALVYEINNAEFRDTPHTFALTRAGRISHVIRAKS